MAVLILPITLQRQIEREARAAFPVECCGLIEGRRNCEAFKISALHPARNLTSEPDRFEIDPTEQFNLMRALRGTGRKIIGCYHSHPNGIAEPSERDGDGEEGFVWLIAALDDTGAFTLAAHIREALGWRKFAITLAENPA